MPQSGDDELIGYLAGCGLKIQDAPPDAPAPSRNLTILLQDESGRRFLAKRSLREGGYATAYEGQILDLLSPLACSPDCPLLLPEVRASEPRLGVLVVNWLSGGESLYHYHFRSGRYPLALGRSLGRALGWLHREGRQLRASLGPQAFALGRFGCVHPFVYTEINTYANLSPAGLQLFEMMHSEQRVVAELHRLLQCPCDPTLLHGDLKLPNLLRLRGQGDRLAFLDWEMALWGDPARDVGAVLAQYARVWLAPMTEREQIDQGQLCRFLGSMLACYQRQRAAAYPLERGFRYRAIRWAGVSLIYYVFAATYSARAMDRGMQSLARHALSMVTDPYQWAWDLLEAA